VTRGSADKGEIFVDNNRSRSFFTEPLLLIVATLGLLLNCVMKERCL
jgi:hypothetical protein